MTSKPDIHLSNEQMEIDTEYAKIVKGSDQPSVDKKILIKTEEKRPQSNDDGVVFSPELLGMYYSRLFPFDFMYSWLSYDAPSRVKPQTSSLFNSREFSFTIELNPGEEIYMRYQSFSSQAELQSAVCKRRPHKIDIGAVFNHPPKDKNAIQKENFYTVQRELVFDIDLTDYDAVRKCGCSGAKICLKCWELMSMAIKVIDVGLREDFGFKHVVWFYSGRRGVHCWVSDKAAREMSNEARSAVASYFDVVHDSENKKGMDLPSPLHPMLTRSYDTLLPLFIDYILPSSGHGLLDSPEACTKLLSTLPDSAQPVKERISARWSSDDSTPEQKWDELIKYLTIFTQQDSGSTPKKTTPKKKSKHLSNVESKKIENWKYETVFKHTYPRLDINVSKMQNHLLKSPFCVHPKTGRVCVPIDVNKVDEFDPLQVPTLAVLRKELDEWEGGDDVKDWQKTSLKESFEHFQKGFLSSLKKECLREYREQQEVKAALVGDF